MSSETLVLVLIAGALAVAFWLTLILLVMASRRNNHWLKRLGLMAVAANFALLWSYAAVARVYDLPGRLQVTASWSRIASGMLAAYLLGSAWLTWRVERQQERPHD